MHKTKGKGGKFVTNGAAKLRENALCRNTAQHSPKPPDDYSADWHEGRRIVELGVLGESLGSCENKECDRVLDLRNTVCESRIGLSSLLVLSLCTISNECVWFYRLNSTYDFSTRFYRGCNFITVDINTNFFSFKWVSRCGLIRR